MKMVSAGALFLVVVLIATTSAPFSRAQTQTTWENPRLNTRFSPQPLSSSRNSGATATPTPVPQPVDLQPEVVNDLLARTQQGPQPPLNVPGVDATMLEQVRRHLNKSVLLVPGAALDPKFTPNPDEPMTVIIVMPENVTGNGTSNETATPTATLVAGTPEQWSRLGQQPAFAQTSFPSLTRGGFGLGTLGGGTSLGNFPSAGTGWNPPQMQMQTQTPFSGGGFMPGEFGGSTGFPSGGMVGGGNFGPGSFTTAPMMQQGLPQGMQGTQGMQGIPQGMQGMQGTQGMQGMQGMMPGGGMGF